MTRTILAAIVVLLAAVPAADAAYYMNKPAAEHDLRLVLHSNYGYSNTGVYCRPKKGRNEHVRQGGRTLFHSWTCGFVAGEQGASCKGAMSIIGSDSRAGFYYQRHWSAGESC